ncbi:hypothetical protein [Bacillus safensis]|uniref:hypothetical protein n=1 Tax=Bacillus safensis TaxID=561879 RepID=UPI002E1D8E94|nr:hypothetical protein [Bacillus safensis]
MKTNLIKTGVKLSEMKNNVIRKGWKFLKEEKSAKGTSEEGMLMYWAITIGIVVLAVVLASLTDGFTALGKMFVDGTNGTITKPNGWGK